MSKAKRLKSYEVMLLSSYEVMLYSDSILIHSVQLPDFVVENSSETDPKQIGYQEICGGFVYHLKPLYGENQQYQEGKDNK